MAANSPTATDEALIAAIACADRDAMQTLFERHRVKVFRFVLRMVRNDALAEELTGEVFLDVWRNAGRFEGRAAAATWVLAIARFKALSVLRRRRECALEETVAARVADDNQNPEAALASKQSGELLRACLGKLSYEHREVIDLVYYHEKSIDEVAQIVNIPANTVKTRMFYARKRLALELKHAGLEAEFV
jgi:RNA polymerase sigma-70 factor, ECF subfamily